MTGAAVGGALGLLLGNKRSRDFAKKHGGTALKVGSVGAIGALAYTVYRNWQSNQAAQAAAATPRHLCQPRNDHHAARGAAHHAARGAARPRA